MVGVPAQTVEVLAQRASAQEHFRLVPQASGQKAGEQGQKVEEQVHFPWGLRA